MLAPLVAIGLTLWLINQASAPGEDEPKPDPKPEPEPRPDPSETEWTKPAVWSGEEVVGQDVVWTYQTGIRYQDGSTEMDSTVYVVIGNSNHTSFLRSNSDRGTIDIPKEMSGGDVDQQNVVVFGSIQEAVDRLNTPDDDGLPTGPQRQPEEEDDNGGSGGGFGFPTQPGYQLGQNGGTFTM